MTVSENLRESINQSDKTLYAIAKGSGVNWSAIDRFMSGERPNIRLDTVDRLCEYLGLELREKRDGKAGGKGK